MLSEIVEKNDDIIALNKRKILEIDDVMRQQQP